MKKHILQLLGLMGGVALSVCVCGACVNDKAQGGYYDSGVVKAFHAVTEEGELVSKTAYADGQKYLVSVITSASVSEYTVDASFNVEDSRLIVGDAPRGAGLTEKVDTMSDLTRAYREALSLSGIAEEAVSGFDFDRDTYMDEAVFKVEIEDAAAAYSYIFRAEDFTLIGSKIQLKAAQTGGTSSYIGEEQAKSNALSAAQTDEASVQNLTVKSFLSGGQRYYRVSFDRDGFRYTIEVDALSGDIVSYSETALGDGIAPPEIPSVISAEEAKAAALAFAFPGGTENKDIAFRKVKLDYGKGGFYYEVELVADGSEYEFEISASDGAILDYEIDTAEDEDGLLSPDGKVLTHEEAIARVREVAGADIYVLEIEIDRDRGENGERRYFYEIEVRVNGRETEYRVDAFTGEVTKNDDYVGGTAAPVLTEEQALRIALNSFSLTEGQLTAKKIKLEREDGRLCYEVKLRAGGKEYSMEIDAQSGDVLEREIDEEGLPSPDGGAEGRITLEQAIAAVRAVAGANAKIDADDVELEYVGTGSNRRLYYEIEAEIGGREFDYYVDALSGEVKLKGEIVTGSEAVIGEEKAVGIAREYFSLAEGEARVAKVKLERDDGDLRYEVKLIVRDIEYTVEIDAVTGKVLEADVSFD